VYVISEMGRETNILNVAGKPQMGGNFQNFEKYFETTMKQYRIVEMHFHMWSTKPYVEIRLGCL
jgi:hypothetical protein